MYKKFCLTLNTLAVPNLITPDLVITHPMSSFSGSVAFLEYVAGSNKGGVAQNTLFNGVYSLGEMNESRMQYTSERVVELVASDATTITPAWTPVVDNKVIGIKAADGAEVEIPLTNGSATVVAGTYAKIKYVYNNEIIPQNDLPTLKAQLTTMPLQAKVRRIAIYYSQIANFQAKTDYGVSLDEQLAQQAIGELAYEIDSETVALLAKGARYDERLHWFKAPGVGVSIMDQYAGFAAIVEEAKAIIYRKTSKFAANYMVIAPEILPVVSFIPGWQAAPVGTVVGPYFAGSFNGLRVYVSPMLADGEFFLGVNGADMQTSAAVYAPYMPIVPTQLLGYADGGMSQGFSTLYDLKLLSVDADGYSPLLIKGKVDASIA